MSQNESVEKQVLAMLKSKSWVSNSELEDHFPKGKEGHYSWPQRLRGLREKGFVITRRIKEGTKNLSEWHLEEYPPTEAEELKARENHYIETKINNGQLVLACCS